jgi:hypothetical protein
MSEAGLHALGEVAAAAGAHAGVLLFAVGLGETPHALGRTTRQWLVDASLRAAFIAHKDPGQATRVADHLAAEALATALEMIMTDNLNNKSDAVLIKPVNFHRQPGESGADRHKRRASQAMARIAEVEAAGAELGQLDLSNPKWVRLLLAEAEVLWSPAEGNLTARVRGKRIPSAHVLDVDSWIEQVRSIAATGGLDLRRARPYSCPVLVWRDGEVVLARSTRPLEGDGVVWDEERRAFVGAERAVWAALRRVQRGSTGAAPDRLFPIR